MPTAIETFFLDTNVFLHSKWLNELPWNDLTEHDPVLNQAQCQTFHFSRITFEMAKDRCKKQGFSQGDDRWFDSVSQN